MGSKWLRVNGVPLDAIAPVSGSPTYSFGDKGCKQLSWASYFAPGFRHPALVAGALVEEMYGPTPIWAGLLAEPNWAEGTFTADGMFAGGGAFLAIDGTGAPYGNPHLAGLQAVADGWQVTIDDSVPNDLFVAGPTGMNTIASLYESQSLELSQRWYVFGDRVVHMAADPTEPTWQIPPGIVNLGVADDDYVSGIVVSYESSPGTVSYTPPMTDAVVAARFGPRFLHVDATSLGVIALSRAEDIGNGVLARGRGRLGWTQTIEVSANQLLTMGGVPADLSLVRSLQVVRIHGVVDDLQYLPGRTYLDVVIGEVNYADGAASISLSPLGKVAETVDEVIAELTTASAA